MLATPPVTDLQRAARWFLLRVCSFSGKGEHWGRGRETFNGWSPARHITLIEQLASRLERVFIGCGDWESVVTFFDSANTFFFFDPPYVNCAATAYEPFTPAEMARIRARLATLKGKWLLTCDDSPQCREIFAGLPARQITQRYSMGKKTGTPRASGQLLVMHPALVKDGGVSAQIPFPKTVKRLAA